MTNGTRQGDKGMRPRVVVLGAGFGGLWTAMGLGGAPVDVVLIDRHNFHTFMPLLYQVAASELGTEQTVTPIRRILRKHRNIRFILGDVTGVDLDRKVVMSDGQEVAYDYLVMALGAGSNFFGIPGAKEYALPLRSLEHAVFLRSHILSRWEEAAQEQDPERCEALLTFAIVGAGPTGVEFAGALQELFQVPLRRDFPEVRRQPRIVLLEALDHALAGMPRHLGEYAVRRLRKMGVEVHLNSMVSEVTPEAVVLEDGRTIPTQTVVWTAGVAGSPLAEQIGLPVNRQGRVQVLPTLQVPGRPEVFVVGDLASVGNDAPMVPMLAPAAMQEGTHTANNIRRILEGLPPLPFRYKDKGMLAVIGRNAAAARIGRFTFTGFPAWLLWAGVHLYQLIGFRNRLLVFINWAWDYLFFERAVRMLLPAPERRRSRLRAGEAAAVQHQGDR